jgi:hypothetical protein
MMDWNDTIGQYIHANMFNKALQMKPDANRVKLEESIKRASTTVGITRSSIADVLEAETSSLAMMRVLGDTNITIDFLAGMLAALQLIRDGKHVTDDNDSYNNGK